MPDIKVKCIFLDSNGICHGRYMGFKCIEEKCEWYGKYFVPVGICAFWVEGYCKKLGLFNCDGKNRECPYYTEYVEQKDYDRLFRKK
ncbi:MAG: hypothetical protein GXO25_03500 [Euryarchaeota archaeon]|nr:hypothetical protein [Euryarchaeota archaeon]